MPSRRDYSAEYRRRQERAQAEGFSSDYERRMHQGDPSRRLPDDPEDREWLRGHRGESYLRAYAGEGDALQIDSDRDSRGRFTSMTLYPADPDREIRVISIRGMSVDDLHDLFDDLADEGVALSVGYLEE